MSRLKKYVKTTLCIALCTALMFADIPATVYAAESVMETEAESTMEAESAGETENTVKDGTNEETTEPATTGQTEGETTKEEQTSEAGAGQEETVNVDETTEIEIETEEPPTENNEETEEFSTDMTEAETEIEENTQELLFADTDIAHGEYKEDGNDITWVIDADGTLTVEGTGDFAPSIRDDIRTAPWGLNGMDIKTAVINVKGMTDASNMFGGLAGYANLMNIDMSNFDTSQITNMEGMFSSCHYLTNLDVSGFDTSNVQNMNRMFSNCYGLTSLDVSGFDTSNVQNMNRMFNDCRSLTSLDMSSLDTSKVQDMGDMFHDCRSLTSLDVSGFNTSNVTMMDSMFESCSSLASLDVSGFDTSKVQDMGAMFHNCRSLTSLDVSGFDTSKVQDMGAMFGSCRSLTSLDLSGFDTSKVQNMRDMFNVCEGLTSLDVSSFDTSKVQDMHAMFGSCRSLTSLDISGFNTSNVTMMDSMFGSCSSLTSLDISGFDTSNVTTMNNMFMDCGSLTSLDMGDFDTSNVRFASDMFEGCNSLTTIRTPRNLTLSVALQGNWYDVEGSSYTELPKERTDSILIYKTNAGGFAEHIIAQKAKTLFFVGETLNEDDVTVIYYGTDGAAKILAQTDYTTNAENIDIATTGERTLTITYKTSAGKTLTADIQLAVKKKFDDTCVTVTLPDTDIYQYTYDSKEKKPIPEVVYAIDGKSVILTEKTDYTVSYKNNINAYRDAADAETAENAPRVIITGRGDYSGKIIKTFEILKAPAPESETVTRELTYFTAEQQGWVSISSIFKDYEKLSCVVGTPIEDDTISDKMIASTPTVDDRMTALSCRLNAGTAGDFVTIPVTFSFVNHEDAVLYIKFMFVGTPTAAKKTVTISGIEIKDSVYNKNAVSYTGTPKAVSEEDNTDVSGTVKLTYTYSGTQADGSAYTATQNAPVNAGSYKLTVAVASNNADYTGSAEYPFTITKAPLTITARDMGLKIGEDLPKKEDYIYDMAGLLEGDSLTTEPTLACNIANTTEAGTYDITVSGADAGMNYEITYQKGTLTVSETGESTNYFTVTFSLSGHGSDITNTGVKEGSLLEKPQEPQAAGYTFTGWYKDQSCTDLWDFGKDTVTSDTTLYAGWTKNGTSGGDNGDDSPYDDSERINLSSVSGEIANIKAKVYDQNAYEPVVKVTVTEGKKKITLTEGADYSVTYQNNTNAGEGKVIVTGNGIYKGQIEKTFTINPKPVKKLKVLTGAIVGTATKQAASGAVYVYDGTKRLAENVDYELSDVQSVKNKTDVVQVTVKGKSNYDGEVITKITVYESGTDLSKLITPDNVAFVLESPAKADQSEYAYTGKAVKPAVTVTIGGTALTNKDYKVQYQNNKDAGTAYVVVTGKGTYKGKAVIPFTIKAETVENANDFSIKAIKDATYNGKLQKPAVKVTIQKNGKTKNLSKKDYTVAYKNNLHAGTATVTVTGKGNYAGLDAVTTFKINPQQIKKASLKGVKNALTLTYNKRTLKEGTDYEPPVYGQENKNKVSVTIKGKGDFTGEMTKTVKTQ